MSEKDPINKIQAVAAMELIATMLGDMSIPHFRISIKGITPYLCEKVREAIVDKKESPELAFPKILDKLNVHGNKVQIQSFIKYFCFMEFISLNALSENIESIINETVIEIQRTFHKETGIPYNRISIQNIYDTIDRMLYLVTPKETT